MYPDLSLEGHSLSVWGVWGFLRRAAAASMTGCREVGAAAAAAAKMRSVASSCTAPTTFSTRPRARSLTTDVADVSDVHRLSEQEPDVARFECWHRSERFRLTQTVQYAVVGALSRWTERRFESERKVGPQEEM